MGFFKNLFGPASKGNMVDLQQSVSVPKNLAETEPKKPLDLTTHLLNVSNAQAVQLVAFTGGFETTNGRNFFVPHSGPCFLNHE